MALFYSAHQLVHAVLDGHVGLGHELRHPEAHGGLTGTNLLVARLFRYIDGPYKSLFGTSLAVRYYGQQVAADNYRERRNNDYEQIRTWAQQELSEQGRHSLPEFLT